MAIFGSVLTLAALACLSFAASTAYISFPFFDPHYWIAEAFEAERTGGWLGYLWRPQVEQRIPTALLVTALDLRTMQKWPSFLVAAAVLWSIGCAGLAATLARARIAPGLKLGVAVLVAILALNIGLAEDFAVPAFSVYLFVAGPALAAFTLFSMSGGEAVRSPLFWLTILFALLASCGNAAGLAAWPALVATAVLSRRSKGEIAIMALAAVACCVLFEAGLGVPSRSAGTGGEGPAHLWKMLVYIASFGAAPWARAIHPALAQTIVGLAFWATAAWALAGAQLWRVGGSRPLAIAGAGLILFGALTAVMATIGRVDELPEPLVPTRYTPFATLTQIGVVLASVRRLERWPQRRKAIVTALAGLATFGLAAAPHGMQALRRTHATIVAASEAFDRTGRQGALPINPDPAYAISVRAELRRRGLAY